MDGVTFSPRSEILLQWQSVGTLPPDAYYAVSVSYLHAGALWIDRSPWVKTTEWAVSEHSYLLDLCDDGQFHWSVQVMLKTGVDADGNPKGAAISPPSGEWTFSWRRRIEPPPPPEPPTPEPPAP